MFSGPPGGLRHSPPRLVSVIALWPPLTQLKSFTSHPLLGRGSFLGVLFFIICLPPSHTSSLHTSSLLLFYCLQQIKSCFTSTFLHGMTLTTIQVLLCLLILTLAVVLDRTFSLTPHIPFGLAAFCLVYPENHKLHLIQDLRGRVITRTRTCPSTAPLLPISHLVQIIHSLAPPTWLTSSTLMWLKNVCAGC